MADPLATELGALIGAAHVVSDPDVLAGHLQDWTGRWHGRCRFAASPADGGEVGAVLAACAREGVHVVVQGGNTGLVGGAVPEEGDVLLLTGRLRDLEPPDLVGHTVVAGAGVPLAELQRHLEGYGLELAVDLAARDSATLGGMAATNAGGLRVLQDGDMRRQVLSVDAYSVHGEQIAVLHELVKDNTGYGLSAVLVGSEGTLAVITRVLLRVVPLVPAGAVVLLGLPDLERVIEVVGAVRTQVRELRAIEAVGSAVRDLVATAVGHSPPVVAPWLVLFETPAAPGVFEDLTACVGGALDSAGLADSPVAAAQDSAGMRALWAWRDRATETLSRAAADGQLALTKLDVTIPAHRLPDFARSVDTLVTEPDLLFVFGHVGDGNLHLNVLGPPRSARERHAFEDSVFRLVAEHGGSISAEHGIGRAKAPWLGLARTAAERSAMRAIKTALDPAWLLGRAIWESPEWTTQ
jgi:FAD/FMN-containing dehydrogenase